MGHGLAGADQSQTRAQHGGDEHFSRLSALRFIGGAAFPDLLHDLVLLICSGSIV
jgi:hypothetical protein